MECQRDATVLEVQGGVHQRQNAGHSHGRHEQAIRVERLQGHGALAHVDQALHASVLVARLQHVHMQSVRLVLPHVFLSLSVSHALCICLILSLSLSLSISFSVSVDPQSFVRSPGS